MIDSMFVFLSMIDLTLYSLKCFPWNRSVYFSCVAVLAVMAFFVSTTSAYHLSNPRGICYHTRYRSKFRSQSALQYRRVNHGYSTFCISWSFRCRRTRSIQVSQVVYLSRYVSESIQGSPYCCNGYVGSPSNCIPLPTKLAIGDKEYHNNSREQITAVGRGGNNSPALACFTPDPSRTYWHFPDGSRVSSTGDIYGFVQDSTHAITLHRTNGATMPTGLYCCGSPGVPANQKLCITLFLPCPSLTTPDNGAITYIPSGSPTGLYSRATYVCDVGFIRFGSATRTCHNDGTWTGDDPVCEPVPTNIKCGPMVHPANPGILITAIGRSSSDGLECLTPNPSRTNWHFPNGSVVPKTGLGGFYSTVQPTFITLNRLNGAILPTGRYCCGSQLLSTDERLCITLFLPCPSLTIPDHGDIAYNPSGSPTGLFTRATYMCRTGYKLFGSATRTCQDNGTWTGDDLVCELTCPALTAPSNGGVEYPRTRTVVGSKATYTCDDGYKLCGNAVRTCSESDDGQGVWSGTQPLCSPVPTKLAIGAIEHHANSNILIRFVGEGGNDSPSLACFTPNPSRTSWHFPNGSVVPSTGDIHSTVQPTAITLNQLNGVTSITGRYCCGSPCLRQDRRQCITLFLPCLSLTTPVHGNIIYFPPWSTTELYTTATYMCDENFSLFGSVTRTCQDNGIWTGDDPVCELTCSALTAPSNSDVEYPQNRTVGSVATYTCDDGYELCGNAVRTCSESDDGQGVWSGTQPLCTPVPTELEIGTIEHPSNSELLFRFIGDGDNDSPGLACSTPNPSKTSWYFPNGSVVHSAGGIYSTVQLTAITIYRLNDAISPTGRYCCGSPCLPLDRRQCITLFLRCPSLTTPDHGDITYIPPWSIGTGLYTTATYMCDENFSLFGSATRTCHHDGTWTGDDPVCELTCPALTAPNNGDVEYPRIRTIVDSVANYTCDNGYELCGNAVRTCISDVQGVWSGTQPSCQPVPVELATGTIGHPANSEILIRSVGDGSDDSPSLACFTPNPSRTSWHFPNGSVVPSTGGIYSTVQPTAITLNRQNNATSPTGRYCCGSPCLSMDRRQCITLFLPCPSLTNPDHGNITYIPFESPTGLYTTATYICDEGFKLFGSATRTCLDDSTWTGDDPICEPCVVSLGFVQRHLTIKEGDTATLCVTNCSCPILSHFTVEIQSSNQIDVNRIQDDLHLPAVVVINEMSKCFEITAIDDDLLEGFEYFFVHLHNPNESYRFCRGRSVLIVSVIDNDELLVGFERTDISVDEGAGQVEICAVVFEPEETVPIPDVVLYMKTYQFSGAIPGFDYTPFGNHQLLFTNQKRKVCVNVSILEDDEAEYDEKFSVIMERNSTFSSAVSLNIEPMLSTIEILDNDGANIGFENFALEVEEGQESAINREICIVARLSSPTIVQGFSLTINSYSSLADLRDYKSINNYQVGPFSYSSNRHCFHVTIYGDEEVESDEGFTLAISGEPTNVMVKPREMLITIINDDELIDCYSSIICYLPIDSVKHCLPVNYSQSERNCRLDLCKHNGNWSHWEQVPKSVVNVSNEICPSSKMAGRKRYKNATTDDCVSKQEKEQHCIPTKIGELTRALGVGHNISLISPQPLTTPSPNPRSKRSTSNQSHCYNPQEIPEFHPLNQCQVSRPCPYERFEPKGRDAFEPCSKRSVLFIIDASSSIGETLFREVSFSLSYFVKNLCGDIQFGLLKFSTDAYLEFCFNCYANDQREELQTRFQNTQYVGHSSFTGYATKCAHNFMFNDSSCGQHDDRCIDIVYVTDGESSDHRFFNVCDEIECMHKNPHISDKLKVYAIGVGDNVRGELECITRYSKLRDNSPPIFTFENLNELIVELNTMIREIELDLHKFRVSGENPKYQCADWLTGA